MAATLQDVDEEVLNRWRDHPLVSRAFEELDGDTDMVDVLYAVHDMMSTLEERFPGVSFSDILSTPASPGERKRIRKALKDHGATPQAVTQLVGSPGRHGQDRFGDREFQFAVDDVPYRELVDSHGCTDGTARSIRSLTQPVTSNEQAFLDEVDQTGCSIADASRHLHMADSTGIRAFRKRRYQEWLEAQS